MFSLVRAGFGILLCWGLLVSCASTRTTSSNKSLFIISANRQLELEPCGCSILQYGGIDREANAVRDLRSKARGDVFYFSAGTAFVPEKPSPALTPEFQKVKREELLAAWNELGLRALAVSGDDAALGEQELRRLASGAKFPFLSANLLTAKGERLFPSHLVFSSGAAKILVIGLSSPAGAIYEPAEGLRIAPASEALDSVFRDFKDRADLVVLLQSLPEQERTSLRKRYGQISIFLGGTATETPDSHARQTAPGVLHATSLAQGRGLAWVEVDSKPAPYFLNPELAANQREYLQVLEATGKFYEKPKLTKSEKAKYEQWKRDYAFYTSLPLKITPEANLYESAAFALNADFSKPENNLTRRIQSFHTRARDLALGTDQ